MRSLAAALFALFTLPALAQQKINLANYHSTFYAAFPSIGYIQDCQGKIPCYLGAGKTWIAAIPQGFGQKNFSALSVGGTLGPGLHITATQDPVTKAWSSGSVSTCDNSNPTKGFYQGLGYTEALAKMPVCTPQFASDGTPIGCGAWPAIWGTPPLHAGIPAGDGDERDWPEWYGGTSPQAHGSIQNGFHVTLHQSLNGVKMAIGQQVYSVPGNDDLSQGFHYYGVDVENDFITFYFDRYQVGNAIPTSTYPEATLPTCIYIDYAFGGGFPLTGLIPGSHLDIQKVEAYQHN
jgi:hypothetical protein